jgi:rSAM/selenodomain-associated transferase 1
MAVWLLAAAWAILSRRYTLAILALLAGMLIKFIPVLLLPVAGLIALRDLPHGRARLRFLAVTTLAAVALVVVAYSPFWRGFEDLGLARRAQLFTASLPAAIQAWLGLNWGIKGLDWEIAAPAASLTLLFVLWQSRQSWRDRSWLNFSQAVFNILMFYLLVACLWFQQWYVIWPLAIAALLPPGHASRLAALFSYTALSKQLIFEPLLFWPQPRLSRFQIELVFGPAVLMIPWLYALLALWLSKQTKSKEGITMDNSPFTFHHSTQSRQARLSHALLVVAKRPAPGQTKTRLSPPLSPEQASALYECFLQDTLALIRQVPQAQPVIAYLPQGEKAYFTGLAPDFELLLQEGADLGARLDQALTYYLERGYERVVIMDSDSPTLPAAYLTAAFELLDEADVVLGPCDDGGYYLIGLKRPAPRLLREVQMSTSTVTAETLALAAEEGLQVKLLPVWYDIDDVTTLRRLVSELAEAPEGAAPYTRAFLAARGWVADGRDK